MPEIQVALAETDADFDAARALCRGFQRFFETDLAEIAHVVERYYPPAAWDALLAELPAVHARPSGGVLIGRVDGAPMGCAMLRPLDDPGAVELKRMFVDPAARGLGLARALLRAACAQALADGHEVMRLDTSYIQKPAQALYRSEGFKGRGPYYEAPADVLPVLVFMEKRLG
ncbi:GNAT family N-acetyltransferase [Rhodovulum sp. DZ06]|uniref:GNAT family N-acetyltransferase n=1 Tax=Rhodovulum sp. DZ06 TaxID=3425126 RepID=UPI003D325D30